MESSPEFLRGSKKSELIEMPLTIETKKKKKKKMSAGYFPDSSSRISLWVSPHSADHILKDHPNSWSIGGVYSHEVGKIGQPQTG